MFFVDFVIIGDLFHCGEILKRYVFQIVSVGQVVKAVLFEALFVKPDVFWENSFSFTYIYLGL